MILQIEVNGVTVWSHRIEESDEVVAWTGEPSSLPRLRETGILSLHDVTIRKGDRQ